MKSGEPLLGKYRSGLQSAVASLGSLQWVATVAVMLLLSACGIDPSAVQSFSQLAPDQSKVDILTQDYADVPRDLIQLDVLHRLSAASVKSLSEDEQTRKNQIKAIDGINSVIVNYMKVLGALANNTLVQTSTDTATLKTGITALQTAEPNLGITPAEITAIGDVSTFLADAATSAYRQKNLKDAIAHNQAPFQKLVATEEQIISRGVLPELRNLRDRTNDLREVVSGLKVESDQQKSEANARAEARAKRDEKAPQSEEIDVWLRGSGAADVASLLLLQRMIQSDTTTINQEIQAAKGYVKALKDIAKAHTALYDVRKNVLSKAGAEAFIKQEGGLLNETYTALQSLNKI